MKKILLTLTILVLCMSMVSCKKSDEDEDVNNTEATTETVASEENTEEDYSETETPESEIEETTEDTYWQQYIGEQKSYGEQNGVLFNSYLDYEVQEDRSKEAEGVLGCVYTNGFVTIMTKSYNKVTEGMPYYGKTSANIIQEFDETNGELGFDGIADININNKMGIMRSGIAETGNNIMQYIWEDDNYVKYMLLIYDLNNITIRELELISGSVK